MGKIYLIRHGHIDHGKEKRCIGITDTPLNESGLESAYLLRQYFKNCRLEAVYCSPLLRCIQTAVIMSEMRPWSICVENQLHEIHMGKWENMPFSLIKKRYPDAYLERGKEIDTYTVPGGESFYDVSCRVKAVFLNTLSKHKGDIAVVAHAGVNRVLISILAETPLKNIFEIEQPYGCLTKLEQNESTGAWSFERLI